MIYFTADLHFGHENIIKSCNRPFETVAEMDDVLMRNWNAVVSKRDDVYILGDFTMETAGIANDYLSALKGRKYFIRGNHDKFLNSIDKHGKHFEWVKDYSVLKYHGKKFVLFHYPIAEWDGFWRGAIHLYGHIHNSSASNKWFDDSSLAFNVGVDCNDFRPVSIEDIIERADTKTTEIR